MSFQKAAELTRLALMAASRRGVTLSEIEEEFGCTRRTAQRMTDALATTFPATDRWVDADDGRPRWRLPQRYTTTFINTSADELTALEAAITLLEQGDTQAEARALRQLASKVRALIPHADEARLATDEEALLEAMGFATRPGPRPNTNVEIDRAIATALKGGCRLRIVYRGRGQEAARERQVEPYGLLLGPRRYLVARDVAKAGGKLQHYRVEDIEAAVVSNDCFTPPADFSLEAHAAKAFGAFQNEAQYGEVVWRFSPKAAPHARRYLFHPSQQMTDGADGSLTVSFHASGHLEMCWHLYCWGAEVEVLQPQALADMAHAHRRADFEALP